MTAPPLDDRAARLAALTSRLRFLTAERDETQRNIDRVIELMSALMADINRSRREAVNAPATVRELFP